MSLAQDREEKRHQNTTENKQHLQLFCFLPTLDTTFIKLHANCWIFPFQSPQLLVGTPIFCPRKNQFPALLVRDVGLQVAILQWHMGEKNIDDRRQQVAGYAGTPPKTNIMSRTGSAGIKGDRISRLFHPIYLGLSPLPVTVTTRIIIFFVGDPYKPSFVTVTGRGDNPRYTPEK